MDMDEQSTARTAPRSLGGSGITVSPLGFGCWAIGGEWQDRDGKPLGWGKVDDDESIAAIHRALDLGITFFDTADTYGTGHSERVLGRALGARRGDVVVATKWGNVFDETTRSSVGKDATPAHARRALTDSLRRLGTDYVDLFQFHLGDATLAQGAELRDACEEFVKEGLIRGYGWSTDDPERAAVFAEGAHCCAVQFTCNVLEDAPAMLALTEELGLAGINRGPLAMGLLTAKAGARSRGVASDLRSVPPAWMAYFGEGGVPAPEWAARVAAVRDVLASDGRSLAQGALAWLWARSPRTLPIPGFRSVEQAEQNAAAMEFGPLSAEQMDEIAHILADHPAS